MIEYHDHSKWYRHFGFYHVCHPGWVRRCKLKDCYVNINDLLYYKCDTDGSIYVVNKISENKVYLTKTDLVNT